MTNVSLAHSDSTQVRSDFVRTWRARIGKVLDLRFGKRPLTQEDLEKILRAQLENEAARRRVDQLIKQI